MRTNKEKYNFWFSKLEEFRQRLIVSCKPPEGYPKSVFSVTRTSIIEEELNDGVYVYDGFFRKDKPTRIEVSRLREFVEALEDKSKRLTKDNIRLGYKHRKEWRPGSWSTSSGSYSMADVESKAYMSFERSELEPVLDENLKKYTLKDGDVRCAYCGAAVKKSEAYSYTVSSIVNYGPKGREGKYCNGTCAMHDQFAHEG